MRGGLPAGFSNNRHSGSFSQRPTPVHPVDDRRYYIRDPYAGVIRQLQDLRSALGRGDELRALGMLRERVWQRDLEDSVQAALNSLPEDAGPLNSKMLLIKTLAAMGDRSPNYLRHWVAYLNVLVWLEEQS